MNPESNGFAPGGLEPSPGFCALSGSVVTEWRVSALLTHSTVSPTLIATFIGWYIGGLSVILTVAAGAGYASAEPRTKVRTVARARIARARMVFEGSKWLSIRFSFAS